MRLSKSIGSRRAAQASRNTRLHVEVLEARNLLDGGLANVLVNDPNADLTDQDTQSETALVLGAGSNVIVAYNDSNGWVPRVTDLSQLHLTGYSRSTDGGATFCDLGTLPETPSYVDAGDPVLARSSKTGTVFLATIT